MPTLAESDHRREAHRTRLMAQGLSRNQSDTEAGRIVAAEITQCYRRTGQWPAMPGEKLGVADLEARIRADRPDLSPHAVSHWALLQLVDIEHGRPPTPIPAEARP